MAVVLASYCLCESGAHVADFSGVKGANNITALFNTPSKQFFQLQAQSNGKCLKLTESSGIYVDCSDRESTVYFLNGDSANNHNIVILGTSQCLDREHCHSSSSNLRYSACDHCGAIHWDIRSDGSLREDNGKNCIYSTSSTQAAVRHCSDGFERFNPLVLGNHFLIKSVSRGDCVSGGQFVDCDCAPTFYVTGTPRNYNIRLYVSGDSNGNICLDREHCHSSTSNLRFSECSHCGAIHWSIEGNKFGEDGMKNCINRGSNDVAYVSHCSDRHEPLSYEIIPPQSLDVESDKILARYFPDPNINQYLNLDLTWGCRGIKLFQYGPDRTVEVEVVHFLPSSFPSGYYNIQYMVTHIHTNIPYQSFYTNEYILDRLDTDPSHVTQINFRYGGIGHNHNSFGGLESEFLTNSGPGAGVPLPPQYYQQTVSNIYSGFSVATNNWSLGETHHAGQIFLYVAYLYHVALYWNSNRYCGQHSTKVAGDSVL